MKAPNRLSERLDLTLVGGFLALGFLNQFEQLVHRFRGVAQGAESRFDFFECLADAGWRGRLGGRRRWLRLLGAMATRLRWPAPFASR